MKTNKPYQKLHEENTIMPNPSLIPLQSLEHFEKLRLRITDICWLASTVPNCNGRLTNIHEDIDFDIEGAFDAMGLVLPDEDDIGSDDYYIDRIIEEGRFGFLARAETPYGFTWGHTMTSWVYGETIQELEQAALNWLEKVTRGSSHDNQ